MTGSLGPVGRIICLAYVAAIGIPLFVLPGYQTTNLTLIFDLAASASIDSQPLRVHWVVGYAALAAGYLAYRAFAARERPAVPPHSGLIAGLGLAFSVALIAGLLMDPSALRLVYFLQTTIPILGFFVGAALADSLSSLRRTFQVLIAATTVSTVCILMLGLRYDVFSGDVIAAYRLARAVPQVREYFPFIVVVSLSMTVWLFSSTTKMVHRILIGLAAGVLLAFYLLAWSRMALVMLALVAATPFVLGARTRTGATWRRSVITAAAVLLGASALLTQARLLQTRLDSGSFERSSRQRLEYAFAALDIIADSPWLGRMFGPDWTHDPRPARELRVPRIYKAHNQYLDYGIRAGVPAVLVLGLIMGAVVGDVRRVLRASGNPSRVRPLAVAVAGALLAVAVGNLTQLFLVQAQTASLAWLLVGVSARMGDLARAEPESC